MDRPARLGDDGGDKCSASQVSSWERGIPSGGELGAAGPAIIDTTAGMALKNDLLQILLKCPGGSTKAQELKHLARYHYGIRGQHAD